MKRRNNTIRKRITDFKKDSSQLSNIKGAWPSFQSDRAGRCYFHKRDLG